jgi:hypothetical protein
VSFTGPMCLARCIFNKQEKDVNLNSRGESSVPS